LTVCREDLREQHALGEEIANAITNTPLGETIDETELDDELAEMEQEQLDDKMLKTGTVPVSDEIHRLPAAVNGERTYPTISHTHFLPGGLESKLEF
jgi:charged multivesicular body protein 4